MYPVTGLYFMGRITAFVMEFSCIPVPDIGQCGTADQEQDKRYSKNPLHNDTSFSLEANETVTNSQNLL